MKKVLIVLSLLFSGTVFAHYNGSEHVHNRGLYDYGHHPQHGLHNDPNWCPHTHRHSHNDVYYNHPHYYDPKPIHRHRHLHDNHRHLRHERLRRGHHPRARRVHYYNNYDYYYYRPSVCVGNRNVSLCID